MSDDEFIASFENSTLDNASFHHCDHVPDGVPAFNSRAESGTFLKTHLAAIRRRQSRSIELER